MEFSRYAFVAIIALVGLLSANPSRGEAQTTNEEQALVLARRAAHRFQAGDFGTASTLLREAIVLHETPALQINLARTLSRWERWQEARDAYVRYLELEPDGERRIEVEQAILELDQQINGTTSAEPRELSEVAEEEHGAVNAAPDTAPAPTAPLRRNHAPWIMLGAGIFVGASGIPLSVLSRSAADRARGAASQQAAVAPASAARTYAITADVLYAIGGAAAVSGLIWGLLSREERNARVSLQIYPGGVGVSGRF